jgi:hypothetical protein
MSELIAMALLAIPCALWGALIAFALGRWAVSLTVITRSLLATIASIFPVAGMAAIATGGSLQLLLSMSPDEFIVPFSVQIALIVFLAAPPIWLISRRRPKARHPSEVFE